MNQNDLKTKIAETLHRNRDILLDSDEEGIDLADLRVGQMLDACAANLAQALPEMLGDETAKLRELCKHAHAALMMLSDYKGSALCDDLKKACGDAE